MYEYKCELIRVVDGDTVDVNIDLGFDIHMKARVRLAGIDAPETRTKDLEEKERGISAKESVESWFNMSGAEYKVRTEFDNRGKYGRILGIFHNSKASISLNDHLLKYGFAVPYTGGKR